jgi:hypothetical protein
MLIGLCAVLLLAAVILGTYVFSRKEWTVGKQIAPDAITEFYCTYSSSANPPDYQRYRFYRQENGYWLYHETRAGDHWPLTEEDITLSGTVALQEGQWTQLMQLLNDGKVVRRSDSAEAGGSGPWLYLYWTGDKGEYQVFSFAAYDKLAAFESLCAELAGADAN